MFGGVKKKKEKKAFEVPLIIILLTRSRSASLRRRNIVVVTCYTAVCKPIRVNYTRNIIEREKKIAENDQIRTSRR